MPLQWLSFKQGNSGFGEDVQCSLFGEKNSSTIRARRELLVVPSRLLSGLHFHLALKGIELSVACNQLCQPPTHPPSSSSLDPALETNPVKQRKLVHGATPPSAEGLQCFDIAAATRLLQGPERNGRSRWQKYQKSSLHFLSWSNIS